MAPERRKDTALLAARAGRYREYAPPPALRRHFSRFWSHALHDGPPALVAIVPDGYCDLLWIDGRLAVAGPDRTAAFPVLRPGTTIIGARFAPGAAAPWLKTRLSALVGRSVPLVDIGWKDTAEFEARLGDCPDPSAAMALFRRLLEEAASDEEDPAQDAAVIFAAADSGRPASGLLGRLDMSERQLRRRCHHHFGYGAKTLERIRRFQRFLDLCRSSGTMPLARLALEAGFADQAHMTREVGELSSLTPAAILDQLCMPERPG
ncbi:helix-turn-helix domain-containing protein [Rhizobium hidalgonense]|uniref:AraC family transcriptional regulator n=1 Tax=Rhizobium hidalgonense TaxID=1538159 RepID=A0A2A6KMM7_9HYPH|nr:helix-turn-helix domain-containing protein [Rhizobium hidalgonense]MDR9771502.1 helix-turn-helix domain-containing protein [Rhizobium hidalgonense]MDR9803444.1 helix-turn-helix domain-containing protein [Rhizobium hidalgonense]MDR9808941.1 helix-turn-helix domain-containing protein [Rhizobium hidalgonense]MDR9818467.1 helix-turn-helix domain-containing protein [Rhizobium hidalgonense]PDT25652.1 AraC family transcriptional regulator [Rhizobium hidalgonense]